MRTDYSILVQESHSGTD